MAERLLVDVAFDGTQEFAHFDSDGELLGLEYKVDDIGSLLDRNADLRTSGANGYGKSKEWKHVASIPPAILMKWAMERGVPFEFMNTKEGFDEIVLKYIYDRDYYHFRTDK